jgi:ferredoxin-type protein NapG
MSDTKNKKTTSRKDVLKTMISSAGYLAFGGMFWGGYIDEAKSVDLVLRPPGAIPENDFIKACIKCGLCVENCPYGTLKLASPNDKKVTGTPYFDAREIPCYMCTDVPCVPVCPTNALDLNLLKSNKNNNKPDINKAKMGLAVVNKETCIAFMGIQCDACYRACPLLDEAITLEYQQNNRTGKHAFLKPVVNANACTGCGICEHACVTEQPAIKILPLHIAMGKLGDHYIKGWDKNDEKRLENVQTLQNDEDINGAIDYLNNSDNLFDD